MATTLTVCLLVCWRIVLIWCSASWTLLPAWYKEEQITTMDVNPVGQIALFPLAFVLKMFSIQLLSSGVHGSPWISFEMYCHLPTSVKRVKLQVRYSCLRSVARSSCIIKPDVRRSSRFGLLSISISGPSARSSLPNHAVAPPRLSILLETAVELILGKSAFQILHIVIIPVSRCVCVYACMRMLPFA